MSNTYFRKISQEAAEQENLPNSQCQFIDFVILDDILNI